jgi:hypothetical protein
MLYLNKGGKPAMNMDTRLPGRVRNTPLPRSNGLFPLFEAVVNSIHAIAERGIGFAQGRIVIEILRFPQSRLPLPKSPQEKNWFVQEEPILGFKITDNGAGFHDKSMKSFETLDSDYKEKLGGRGMGRLYWLKAFERVNVSSVFQGVSGGKKRRSFVFNARNGVDRIKIEDAEETAALSTCIHLDGFSKDYREKTPKTAATIANSLLEHCLWFFVREEGVPDICVKDDEITIDMAQVYEEYMAGSSSRETINIKEHVFELTHLKLKTTARQKPFLSLCADSRVVKEVSIAGEISGLHGKMQDEAGEFVYACYVVSDFLNQRVQSDRIDFDIDEISSRDFFVEISYEDLKKGVLAASAKYLEHYLNERRNAGKERVEKFVSRRAPRYRPIISHISEDKLCVDPDMPDKDLEAFLHRQLSEIENRLLVEGQEVMNFKKSETVEDYRKRLSSYLETVSDIKKSDLASYVTQRKVILDIFEKSLQRGENGKYEKEEIIHDLIIPMQKTSNEIMSGRCNLWLLDERLTFHDFLASDKTLSSMPITKSSAGKEPDICALSVFDTPILLSEGKQLPLASIVVVEIKRPMRNDAKEGEDKDPIEQVLGYLERIRKGEITTTSGRPIPKSDPIPGFCYVICDITPKIQDRCRLKDLTPSHDYTYYFGYSKNFNAYIEVISFDGMLNSAKQRNRAFFDQLGLPVLTSSPA